MARNKVYLSFDYVHDNGYGLLLQAWNLKNFDFIFNNPKPVKSNNESRIKAVITRKMKESTFCLVIIGEHTHKSKWVSWEIENANKLGLKLVAAKIDQSFTEPDALLGKTVSKAMSFKQDSIINALDKVIANPIFTSGDISQSTFVGRESELNEIFKLLLAGQNISIFGENGIGKTSLLNFLCDRGSQRLKQNFRLIYINLQGISDVKDFWKAVISKLGAKGNDPETILKLSQEYRVVLCIDEFDKAENLETFSLDFWDILRSYAQRQILSFVIASRRPLTEIEPTRKTSPFSNIFTVIELHPITNYEAKELINKLVKGTSIQFTEEEIQEIIIHSDNSPFKIYSLFYEKYNAKIKFTPKNNAYGTSTAFTRDISSDTDKIWGGVYTQALADFITHPDTEPPIVIGINAPWGTGKSTLMKSLRNKIDSEYKQPFSESEAAKITRWDFWKKLLLGNKSKNKDKKPTASPTSKVRFSTVWFNAWKYSKEEQLWAALMHNLFKQLTEGMERTEREQFLLKLNMKRIDKEEIRKTFYQSILNELIPRLIIGVPVFIFSFWYLGGFQNLLGSGGIILTGLIFVPKIWDILKKPFSFELANYVKKPNYEEKIGFFGEVEEDFKRVQDLLVNQKLVIFIDDLDRCAHSKIVDVVEAINVLFSNEQSRCIFVIGMDANFIAKSIECAYDPLVKAMEDKHTNGAKCSFGNQFLQKIVQVTFNLSEPKSEQMQSYLNSIINPQQGNDGKTAHEEILKNKIKSEIRQKATNVMMVGNAFKKERENVSSDAQSSLDEAARDVAVEMMTEKDPKVHEVLEEALNYLEKNPRQVKRFLNIFRLTIILNIRQRGPLSKKDFQQLAKWIALSMRYPEFAKKIQLNNDLLTRFENAASDDVAWAKINNKTEWKDIIDNDMQRILKNGVHLSNAEIDFTTLI